MRYFRYALAVLALLVLAGCHDSGLATNMAATDAAAATIKTAPQLRREGQWLVDPQGRVVLLHGVNMVWKNAPYVPPATAAGFIAADAQWLATHGFNAARIGTLWVGVTPQAPGQVDENYLRAWDRVVNLLAAQKIWMLFDFHQDMMSPEFGGEGVPEWAVEQLKGPINNLPPLPLGFPFSYFTPQVSALYDNLWANRGAVREGFRNAWVAVAKHWRDQPYSMGYDLLNEPWAGLEWPTCLLIAGTGLGGCPNVARDEVQPFMNYAREGIRQVDPDNLVWYEPQLLFGGTGLPAGFQPTPGDAQIGFSFHNYCPHAALLQAAQVGALPLPVDLSQTCTGFIDGAVRQGQATAEQMGAVAAMTEFGASDDLTILRATTAAADANFTSWFHWAYKNWADPTTQSQGSGGQSLFTDDADLETVKLDKLRILQRTYPQATAGIPKSLSFDPDTGAFHYVYTPRAADGPTEIYVPVLLHYPNGYAVEVTGAEVTSAPNSSRLILRNLPGANEVSVAITANPPAG